jgi:hypothetical protein
MWLLATALGLGMHLVSVTTTMADDPAFCRILGLPVAEYALNGCAIGVPAQSPDVRSLPEVASATTRLAELSGAPEAESGAWAPHLPANTSSAILTAASSAAPGWLPQ